MKKQGVIAACAAVCMTAAGAAGAATVGAAKGGTAELGTSSFFGGVASLLNLQWTRDGSPLPDHQPFSFSVDGAQWDAALCTATCLLTRVSFSDVLALDSKSSSGGIHAVFDQWSLDLATGTLSARVSGWDGDQPQRFDVLQSTHYGSAGIALQPDAPGTQQAGFALHFLVHSPSFADALGEKLRLNPPVIAYLKQQVVTEDFIVRIQAVPEPDSWMLMGLGGVAAAAAIGSRSRRLRPRADPPHSGGT